MTETSIPVLLERVIHDDRTRWTDMCLVAQMIFEKKAELDRCVKVLAQGTRRREDSLRRKFKAILYHLAKGTALEHLIESGEGACVSLYAKSFPARDQQAEIRLRVPVSLKEAFEAQLERIGSLIGNASTETKVEAVNSILTGLDAQQIRQLLGPKE